MNVFLSLLGLIALLAAALLVSLRLLAKAKQETAVAEASLKATHKAHNALHKAIQQQEANDESEQKRIDDRTHFSG